MVGSFLKRQFRRGLQRFGYDLRRTENFEVPNLFDFLVSRQVDLVLDVGANTGQFATNLRNAGYAGDIVSFEPVYRVFEQLAKNAALDPNWKTAYLALGAVSGRRKINVSDNTVFSSFREQSSVATRWSPDTAVVRTEEVEVATVDEILEPFRGRSVFLKIDTQGYERQVLEGARACLKVASGVQLELPIVHFYRNTWSLSEAIDFMWKAGFIVSQIAPVNFHKEDRVSLVEVDCVFRRCGVQDS
jgi:FkbM family methyltransferase